MDWKDFFTLSVMRETEEGPLPYFQSELKVSDSFSMEELLLKEFDYLALEELEKKHLSLCARKIILRHHFFHSPEFDRIVANFDQRLLHEREKELTFFTHGGGIYLFMALLKLEASSLHDKKLICYTSEIPLKMSKWEVKTSPHVHLIYRPHSGAFFKNFPGLWQNPHIVDLSRIPKA